MKKLVIIFYLLAIALSFTACNEAQKKLALNVKGANEECPISLGMLGDIAEMTYLEDQNVLKIVYSFNDDMRDVSIMKNNESLAKNTVKLAFAHEDANELLNMVADANAGMLCIYQNKESGVSAEISLSPEEIKEMVKNPMAQKERDAMLLASQIELDVAGCPILIDEGMSIVNVYDDGNYVVYLVETDENIIDIDNIANVTDELKKGFAGNFEDESMRMQLQLMSSVDHGLIYRFKGNRSGKTCDVVYTAEELAAY